MIRYFSRQTLYVRNGKSGQAIVLFLVVVCTVMTLLFASIVVHNTSVARVSCANAIDAVALNAATWEARGLNMIAALNEGISLCMQIIRWTCVVWAALAVAAAFGVGLPAFSEYSKYARELIANCWQTAHMLASWSEQIRGLTPYLVLGETIALAEKRNVEGILYPFDPRGPHDGKNTLELHLEPGPPIHLIDAFDPIFSALNRLGKIRFPSGAIKTVKRILGNTINSILGGNPKPVHMLVPEKDFLSRQFVRFVGSQKVRPLPIPFLGKQESERVFDEAQAEPYGGDTKSMTWKSRLTKREEK